MKICAMSDISEFAFGDWRIFQQKENAQYEMLGCQSDRTTPPNRIENFTLHLPIFCAQENDFNYCSIRNSRKITLFISSAEYFREWIYYCSIRNSQKIPLFISLAECFRKWIYYYCSICNSRKISLFISLV